MSHCRARGTIFNILLQIIMEKNIFNLNESLCCTAEINTTQSTILQFKKKGKTKLNLKESERSRRKEIKDLKINEIEFRQQRKSTKPKAGSLNIARREHTFS